MKKYECDKCGMQAESVFAGLWYHGEGFDLCPACRELLRMWIRGEDGSGSAGLRLELERQLSDIREAIPKRFLLDGADVVGAVAAMAEERQDLLRTAHNKHVDADVSHGIASRAIKERDALRAELRRIADSIPVMFIQEGRKTQDAIDAWYEDWFDRWTAPRGADR